MNDTAYVLAERKDVSVTGSQLLRFLHSHSADKDHLTRSDFLCGEFNIEKLERVMIGRVIKQEHGHEILII
jgi:hypothetical protein